MTATPSIGVFESKRKSAIGVARFLRSLGDRRARANTESNTHSTLRDRSFARAPSSLLALGTHPSIHPSSHPAVSANERTMSRTARASVTPVPTKTTARHRAASRPRRASSSVIVRSQSVANAIEIQGVHHVAIICDSLERSMDFYGRMLGLEINPERPEDKLPYRGAWLWIGPEMIHLMELPNPDVTHVEFRPTHGGRDRHFCIGVKNIQPLIECLEKEGVAYTASKSGRPAIFFRDPDANTLEVVEGLDWRS